MACVVTANNALKSNYSSKIRQGNVANVAQPKASIAEAVELPSLTGTISADLPVGVCCLVALFICANL
jgi:hypothetical protein